MQTSLKFYHWNQRKGWEMVRDFYAGFIFHLAYTLGKRGYWAVTQDTLSVSMHKEIKPDTTDIRNHKIQVATQIPKLIFSDILVQTCCLFFRMAHSTGWHYKTGHHHHINDTSFYVESE